MKDFKERFNNSFSVIEEKRKKIAEEKRKERELEKERKREQEKQLMQSTEKKVDGIYLEYEKMFKKDTIEYFLTKMEKHMLPPYNTTYTLGIGLDKQGCLILEKKIEKELRKELPKNKKIELKVCVEDRRIEHGHEEGDNHAGCWVHDYTEYKLWILISLNF